MAKSSTNLSRPAFIAAVAYMVMAFVILLPFDLSVEGETQPKGYVFTQRLFMLALLLIPIGLSVYSINCYVVGNCMTWSYINAILVVLWVLMFVLATVLSSRVQSNASTESMVVSRDYALM
jgi:uncharacterized membrane protein (DUF485 family)